MPSVPRRLRIIGAIAVAALTAAVVLATRPSAPTPAVAAHRVATATDAANLPRPPWYGMRVLEDPTSFHEGPARSGAPAIPTAAGILVDADTGEILWQENAHAQLPPASTTKILTALVALENFSPDRTVTITESALHQAPDETVMGIAAGQTYTLRELLTGMLIVSGNDAATAVAEDTVGVERFVGAMNAQAAALGLSDAHFTSPVGLQDADHHASAYDLAVISAVAVRHFPLFASIVATQETTLPATIGHPAFDLHTVNLLLAMYPYAVGIKPGWTGAAGNCEVGMAVRDGHRLISVLLDADYDFRNSARLLDWGFVQEGLPTTLPTPAPSPTPRPTPKAHG